MRDILRDILEVLLGAVLAAFLLFITGCAPQKRPPVQPPAQAVVAPAPVVAPTPEPVAWQPAYQPTPPPPSRPARSPRRVEVMGPGGKTLPHESGGKFTLTCTEFGTLTIRFPAGERLLEVANGATGEWAIVPKTMGIDLPIPVIAISRTPQAPTTEIQVMTDAEIYQFILVPKTGGVSVGQASTFVVINPETEIRRAENRQREMEMAEAERREREPQVPRLDPEQLRIYHVSGDRVPWMPLSVVGDNRRTVIQLPSGVATQPTFTVIEDGKEVRVNARSIVKADGKGVRIVVDQPFREARLIGAEGTVSIVGGN